MLTQRTKDVAAQIGEFYLEKNRRDYNETADDIRKLGIAELIVLKDRVIVKTARPGRLIGKKGQNIENLTKHLGLEIHIIEVDNEIENALIPIQDFDETQYEN